jgi:hypothetical protein
MSKIQLTEREKKVIALFSAMSPSIKPRLPGWAVEIGFPVALALYRMVAQKQVFLGMAVGGLIGLNTHRMFRQFTFAKELKAICTKLQAHQSEELSAQPIASEGRPATRAPQG